MASNIRIRSFLKNIFQNRLLLKKLRLRPIISLEYQDVFCRGFGLEVGALSKPYDFVDARVEFADVAQVDQLKNGIKEIPIKNLYHGKFNRVDYILKSPKFELEEICTNKYDFVYSSHSLEHSKNPLNNLVEYLRVIKKGGFLYTIIPNRNYTYDRDRKASSFNYLLEKYLKRDFEYSVIEAEDIIINHGNHDWYRTLNLNDAARIATDELGRHHYYTFDENNVMEIILWLKQTQNCTCRYFNISNEIHFVLQKN